MISFTNVSGSIIYISISQKLSLNKTYDYYFLKLSKKHCYVFLCGCIFHWQRVTESSAVRASVVNGVCINSISYSDDMVLLSPSFDAVRRLLRTCELYAEINGLGTTQTSEYMIFRADTKWYSVLLLNFHPTSQFDDPIWSQLFFRVTLRETALIYFSSPLRFSEGISSSYKFGVYA